MTKDSIVVLLVLHMDGQYLLIRRNDTGFNAGKWEFPGGQIENENTAREEALKILQKQVLGIHGIKGVKRFSDFILKLDRGGLSNQKVKFICYSGCLDLPLYLDEYESKLRTGLDHQTIGILQPHEIRPLETTPETDKALIVAMRQSFK